MVKTIANSICRIVWEAPKPAVYVRSGACSVYFGYLYAGFGCFLIALCCTAYAANSESRHDANLLPALRPYVNEVVNELGTVSAERSPQKTGCQAIALTRSNSPATPIQHVEGLSSDS